MNTHRTSVPAREPALTVGAITALVSALLALIVVLGVQLPTGFEAVLLAVITAAAPIVGAVIVRARVTPTPDVVEQRDGSTVVAGAGHDAIPESEPIRAVHDA